MRASASSSTTRRCAAAYSRACWIDCATCAAIASSRSISACVNSRGAIVRTLSAPSSLSRERIGTARIDWKRSSGRFGNDAEARIEVRVRRQHHGLPLLGGDAGDALAERQPRALRHLLDARAVGRAKHELARALVVEVDEARVGAERVRDLARDEREHLLEVERRVDRLDRLGQELEVPPRLVHVVVFSPRVSKYDWLLFLHVTGAFLFLGAARCRRACSTSPRCGGSGRARSRCCSGSRASPWSRSTAACCCDRLRALARQREPVGYGYGDGWVIAALVLLVSRTPPAPWAASARTRRGSSPNGSPRRATHRARS